MPKFVPDEVIDSILSTQSTTNKKLMILLENAVKYPEFAENMFERHSEFSEYIIPLLTNIYSSSHHMIIKQLIAHFIIRYPDLSDQLQYLGKFDASILFSSNRPNKQKHEDQANLAYKFLLQLFKNGVFSLLTTIDQHQFKVGFFKNPFDIAGVKTQIAPSQKPKIMPKHCSSLVALLNDDNFNYLERIKQASTFLKNVINSKNLTRRTDTKIFYNNLLKSIDNLLLGCETSDLSSNLKNSKGCR